MIGINNQRIYSTFDPTAKGSDVTLSAGNFQANATGAGTTINHGVRGNMAKASGKWYWEITILTTGKGEVGVGNVSMSTTLYMGTNANGCGWSNDGRVYKGGIAVINWSLTGGTWTTGNVLGLALDMDARTLACYKNNILIGTITSANLPTGDLYLGWSNDYKAVTGATLNTGQKTFVYAPPSGFSYGFYK